MYLVKLPLKSKFADFTVEKWHVGPHQTVEKGQILCELVSAEAKVELQAPQSGSILEVLAPEGSILLPGQSVAVIGQAGETAPAGMFGPKAAEKAAPAVEPEAASPEVGRRAPVKAPEVKPAAVAVKGPAGAVVPILMPQAGQSMEEGTILAWKVKEGDRIEIGQIIMEIETDKATMEVEAVDAGRVARIVVGEGETVDVKAPVAYLAEDDIAVDAYLAAQGAPQAAAPAAASTGAAAGTSTFQATQTAATVSETGRVKASPAARKLAAEKGINLSAVAAGSGPGGRILTGDLGNVQPAAGAAGAKRVPLTKMRKAIAQNLSYSKQNVPHFYARLTVNAGSLFETYQQTKTKFKCSVNDFITRACAKAIRQYPAFRSRYEGGEILEFGSVNIGVAVGTDEGLTVPVVIDADKLSLQELSQKTRGVVENARAGKLEGIGKGVFTISNLGMFGTEEFAAIINPPEAAILAVGAIREAPVVENGEIRAARLMTMTLSVDHRVVDGVAAAQFLQMLKELLESPASLAD